jgi:hypothetical protein
VKKYAPAIAAAFVLTLALALAGNIKVKHTGPSGQGDLVYYAPSTGTTNIHFGTNGVELLTLVDGSLESAGLSLASNKFLVGNASGVSAEVTLSGDVLSSFDGTMALQTNVVVDADINASAAIAESKLALVGVTTNIFDVMMGDSTTNRLVFTNGIFKSFSSL